MNYRDLKGDVIMYFRISHINCISHNVFVTGYLGAENNKPEEKGDLQ